MRAGQTRRTMKNQLKEMFDTLRTLGPLLLLGTAGYLSGCNSTGGWQGAGAEKMYDQNLEAIRATAVLNNDDYYELHRDGRIYVLADVADVKNFEGSGEIALRLTRIGGGPNGETVVFAIAKPESRKKDGFGAVEMFDRKREGSSKGFYAEVFKDERWYLFDSWAGLDAFRNGSTVGLVPAGAAADGAELMASGNVEALKAKFRDVHGS